ncbi:transposase [Verrucomicrobiaceae bacterium 227]
MKKPRRFLVPSDSSGDSPPVAIYHVVTRVVDRQFVLEADEKEQLRILLRMYERFSGCRVLSYCLMSNHLHVLLEVPPGCEKGESLGLSDEALLRRLGGLYSRNATEAVRREMEAAKALISGDYPGVKELTKVERVRNIRLGEEALEAIHVRYSYRMHSLSEFFKGMLQRFTCWFNREHGRKGVLWESRFRSVIVEDGLAARTMAAYIDLNPVRAGICEDPADYRWSSYGEAVGGGRGAKMAQEGLVRALYSFGSREVAGRSWSQGGVGKEYRKMLISAGMEQGEERGNVQSKRRVVVRKGMNREAAEAELERLSEEGARDLKISKVVRCRVRYFTDGAVIGSKAFVNGVFQASRERFGPKRNDGARKPRGALGEMAGEIWSLRDLKVGEKSN